MTEISEKGLEVEDSSDTITVKVTVNRWVFPDLFAELSRMPVRHRAPRLTAYIQAGQLGLGVGVGVEQGGAVATVKSPSRKPAKLDQPPGTQKEKGQPPAEAAVLEVPSDFGLELLSSNFGLGG